VYDLFLTKAHMIKRDMFGNLNFFMSS